LAGIISSIAELIAAYSPPMPMPATIRVAYRKMNQWPPLGVTAVSPLPLHGRLGPLGAGRVTLI